LIVSDNLGVAVVCFLLDRVGAALIIECAIRDLASNMANGIGGHVQAEPPVPVFSRVEVGVGKAFDGVEQAAAHRKAVKLQDSGERYGHAPGLGAADQDRPPPQRPHRPAIA
jgi:hypothetical protein